jgi:hypothetical protein
MMLATPATRGPHAHVTRALQFLPILRSRCGAPSTPASHRSRHSHCAGGAADRLRASLETRQRLLTPGADTRIRRKVPELARMEQFLHSHTPDGPPQQGMTIETTFRLIARPLRSSRPPHDPAHCPEVCL